MELTQQFRRARAAGTPLLCVRTADPAATISALSKPNGKQPPILRWDIVNGIRAINKAGETAMQDANIDPDATVGPVDALIAAARLPNESILFFSNAHRVIQEQGVSQAIWNLRDPFKHHGRSLVLLCPSIELPAEIQQDVLVLDEPLPDFQALEKIVRDTFQGAGLPAPAPGDESVVKATDAICGLAAFPAEQVCAMSISKSGLDVDQLWERKRQAIEMTPGLSVWRGGETFDGIGGCENVKAFMMAVLHGHEPPRAIVYLDEIDKQMAGAGTDTSGVATEMHGSLLTWMQDHKANGSLFLGPPGAAKSVVAKATGNTAGIPTIAFDLGAMKSSLVGDSGSRLRQALKVIQAISQGQTFWVATCLDEHTIVQAADGALMEISKSPSGLLGFDMGTGDQYAEQISGKFDKEVSEVLRVESSAPDLYCTKDHTLFQWSPDGPEEVTAEQVKPDSYLAAPVTLPGGANSLNHDLAYLLGYTIGDGNISADRMQWSEQDQGTVNLLTSICAKLSHEPLGVHQRKYQNSNLVYSPAHGITVAALGAYPSATRTGQECRAVPLEISRASNDAVAAFLSGVFDAEGSVHYTSKGAGMISLTVTSRLLRDQIYMLLQRFDIFCTCTTGYPKPPRLKSYRVNMAGDSAVRFHNTIGFRMKRKQDLAATIKPRPLAGKRGKSVESVPVSWDKLYSLGYNRQHHDPIKKGNRYPSMERPRLIKIRHAMSISGLDVATIDRWLAFHWVRVKRITANEGAFHVYDLTVPLTHTFCAAGIVVHNCNSIGSLSPELRRRFKSATFFFDLPQAAERKAIWSIYLKKYSLPRPAAIPNDEGWTGAEIETCCDLAYRLRLSLLDASNYIVPVAKSDAVRIQALREQASGKFTSAANPGVYQKPEAAQTLMRRIEA